MKDDYNPSILVFVVIFIIFFSVQSNKEPKHLFVYKNYCTSKEEQICSSEKPLKSNPYMILASEMSDENIKLKVKIDKDFYLYESENNFSFVIIGKEKFFVDLLESTEKNIVLNLSENPPNSH